MFRRIATSLFVSVLVFFGIALALVFSQRLDPNRSRPPGLDFDGTLARGFENLQPLQPIRMRDGTDLPVRVYGDNPSSLVLLIHGSGWHGAQFDRLAKSLSDQHQILVPDLRGHGIDPERRGDIDYIGQFEDDLADLIGAYSQNDQQVMLIGHSSGGGLVIRFAGGQHSELIDRAVLLAPFIHHNAPTMRENSGGWARPLTRRIIGLSMLNMVGVEALNYLPVIEFAMPEAVLNGPWGATATTAYSYRLNTSFAPRPNYAVDVSALPPFLLIAGERDEAFFADKYESTLSAHSDLGDYHILPGLNHLDLVDAAQTAELISDFLAE